MEYNPLDEKGLEIFLEDLGKRILLELECNYNVNQDDYRTFQGKDSIACLLISDDLTTLHIKHQIIHGYCLFDLYSKEMDFFSPHTWIEIETGSNLIYFDVTLLQFQVYFASTLPHILIGSRPYFLTEKIPHSRETF